MSPRLIYLAAITVLIAAGGLLSVRDAAPPTGSALPPGCTSVPEGTVTQLFPGEVATSEATGGPAVRYGRWLDADGEVLLELRCGRPGPGEAQAQRRAVEAARRDEGLVVLDTDPAATLDVTTAGSVIRQVDEDAGVARTWFVARQLSPAQAARLVEVGQPEGVDAAPDAVRAAGHGQDRPPA